MSSRVAVITYRNYLGSQEDLLTKDNYDFWAPVIKRELQGKNRWTIVDGTVTAPAALGPAAAVADILLHDHNTRQYHSDKAATGAYIYNACSKSIQERYLDDISIDDPHALWERLQTRLQANDGVARTRLFNRFTSYTWKSDLDANQFANKLKRVQSILSPVGTAEEAKIISDEMIIQKIIDETPSNLGHLANELASTATLTLASVLAVRK